MLSNDDFNTIYLCCRSRLLRIARSGVPCDADAEDVLHDAFTAFFKKSPAGLSIDEAKRYLFRCVSSALSDWWRDTLRRRDRHAALAEGDVNSTIANPLNILLRKEE